MRRLLALIVIIGLGLYAFYHWKDRPAAVASVSPPDLGAIGERLGAASSSVKGQWTEAKLTGSVKAALALNRSLTGHSIEVATETDIVVLRGTVAREDERAAAERVAGSVPGVRQVRNEIRVDPAAAPAAPGERTLGENIDDRALEAKVNLALSLHRDMKGSALQVSAYRREVTLAGTVSQPPQRELALLIAREIPGVAAVRDRIGGGAASPLAERVRLTQDALDATRSLGPYALTVREEAGQIVVSGRVRTDAERELAGLVAKDAARESVRNTVTVEP